MSLLDALRKRSASRVTKPQSEWERIKNIPTRVIPEGLVQKFTERLKRPNGTMSLRPIQAQALYEAETYGGILGFIPTGAGKSLTSLLLPMVMPNVKVAVLLVPPQLKAKLLEADYPTLSKHWRLPSLGDSILVPGAPKLYPVAYSELSSPKQADILEELGPDLIIADEAHSVVRASARTRRLFRYFKAHPQTRFCPMSGTLISKSIKDVSVLSRVALRRNNPLPVDFFTLERWAETLDPRPDEDTRDEEDLPAYAEIRNLCKVGESLRAGFFRRVSSSPGVITSSTKRLCQAGLEFYQMPLRADKPVQNALESLRKSWKLGEEELEDAVAFSRAARQLAAGMYTRWIWPRNEPLDLRKEWMARRADWHRVVRNYLSHNPKAGMDSPFLLAKAASEGNWPSGEREYRAWKEIEESCQPEPDVVWVSEYLAKDAAEWGAKNTGIIWYYHKALGPKIAALGGFGLFADVQDASALLRENGDRTIVASANAFGIGFDLERFSKQLMTTPSSNASRWQQLLARTHRHGQKADVVETHMYLHTPELHEAMNAAMIGAKFKEEAEGEQLLLWGTHTWK